MNIYKRKRGEGKVKKFTLCMLLVLLFVPTFLCACDNKLDLYVLFNDDSATFYVGDSVDLDEVGYKSNADFKDLNFNIKNDDIAQLQNNKIVFLKSGHTKLVLSIKGCNCVAEIDLTIKPKVVVPDLNPEKPANDKNDNSTESRDENNKENSNVSQSQDDINVISNGENKDEQDDKKSENGKSQKDTDVFEFDDYIVTIKKEECSLLVKNFSTLTTSNRTSFSLVIQDESGNNVAFSYEVCLPNGYPTSLIYIDRTSDTLSLLCLSKCDFCLIISTPNSLGYMTITFRVK